MVYILLLGFIIPNLIITYTSIAVLQYHKKVSSNKFREFSRKPKECLNYQIFLSCYLFQIGQNREGSIAQIKSNRHKKVERMVFLMIFAYNMSWTPYALVCFLRLINLNFLSPAWTVPGFIFTKWWVIKNHLESNTLSKIVWTPYDGNY